jgi:hypothetical protein
MEQAVDVLVTMAVGVVAGAVAVGLWVIAVVSVGSGINVAVTVAKAV